LSSIEGINRNRITKRVYPALRHMLLNADFLENLDLSGVSLGNNGIKVFLSAFKHGLETN
jgi:hypothetical protein